MINVTRPLMAKIYDFDPHVDDSPYVIRRVDKIEFPCRRHKATIIWYSGGFRSESFELLPQSGEVSDSNPDLLK